jgi:2-polyprenyl-3-methyl-5-hydroxy-6-metoxy-1,4-benzoquinol methylase/glycosyltransferase involved in cell wall biosynthesis
MTTAIVTSPAAGPPAAGTLPAWVREICIAAVAAHGASELLEIGCGDGTRLSEAIGLGLAVMGVEADAAARTAARQRLRGCFITAAPEQLPPHGFDLLLLTGVLEAVENPYSLFHMLFGSGAITPRTQVLAELDPTRAARNIWTVQALAALFDNLNFTDCAITKTGGKLLVRATGSDFTAFMQERFVPGTWSELSAYEHLPRYDYAARLAAGARVLDFGCGTGYGAARLALAADSVLAVDLDERALAYARAHHRRANLQFARNADLAVSLPAAQFDLITCFEVIEHIPAAEQAALVAQFARLLTPDGILLISTPNPAVTALYGDNPYHLHEMQRDEFRALLTANFPRIRLFMQRIAASVFVESEEPAPLQCEPGVFPGAAAPAVYIAACANSPLPDLPTIVYPDFQRDFIVGHLAMLASRNLHSLDRLRLVQLGAQAAQERQAWLVEKAAISAEQETARAELRAKLQATQAELRAAQAELRATLAALQAAETAADHLRQNLQQAERVLHDARAEAAQVRQHLAQIENSTSWRAMRRVQPLLAVLRPIIRPVLSYFWRRWRRVDTRPIDPARSGDLAAAVPPPEPVLPGRNLALEESLEPVWNQAAARYDLHVDGATKSRQPGGWVSPYHVRPFHRQGPASRRILHIIPNVFIGGSTQLIIDLVQNLPRPFEHVILTSAIWPGGAHQGITVHQVPTPDAVAMAALLDDIRPDLVHVHYWGLTDDPWYHAALAAVRKRGLPALQNINTPVAPLVDRVFSAYIFVSRFVMEQFGAAAQASGATLAVIHPGIDLSKFGGLQTATDAENAIGMVYRLEDDKLREDSIELLIEVVRRRPRTRAYVVGGGRLLEPFLAATERAGVRENFRFTGYVPYDTLPGWYEKFRIFVAPVWKESFGQVAPFAMSKGCAVAGFDVGALAEICGGRETLGADLSQVADLIVQLLEDPERLRRIGKANSIRAREMFGLETMIARYTELYDQLLADPVANGARAEPLPQGIVEAER